MSVTQKDVANHLGISQRSVAFALNDSPQAQKQLNPETRRKILQAVDQLGYRPHRHAQLMRTRKSGLIGMIQSRSLFQSIVERSHFTTLAIHQAGYRSLSTDLSSGTGELSGACNTMIDARVEGVILAGPDTHYSIQDFRRIQEAGIPMVGLGGQRFPGIPYVMPDIRQGMRDLTRHLIALGHTDLALIVPELTPPDDEFRYSGFLQRIAGFQEAVAEAHLTRTQIIHQPISTNANSFYEPGRLAAQQLLTGPRPPQVIVCSDDNWAIGAFKACADLGIRVPHDVAITGFNDSSIAQYTASLLTSVAQPVELCAQKAVDLLVEMLRGKKHPPSLPPESIRLPCRLVVRDSCGAGLAPNSWENNKTQRVNHGVE